MTELVLVFTPPPGAELIATRFSFQRLKGPITARLGAYDRCFKWSPGVRALTTLLLQTVAWARNGRDDHPQPSLEGRRPSIAASLNDVLTSKPQWVADVFGESDGHPVLPALIGRWNADFNTCANAPVRLWLECDRLPPDRIRVEVDGKLVDDPVSLAGLADDVRQQWGRGKVGPAAPETEPDGSASGVGVRVDLRMRRVTVEIVLDRDYDSFTAEDEEKLLLAIRTVLRTSREIPVRDRRRGSVIVSLELTEDEGKELAAAVAAGGLADFCAVAVRILPPADVLAPEHVGTLASSPPVAAKPTPGENALDWGDEEPQVLDLQLLPTHADKWQAGDRDAAAIDLLRAAEDRLVKLARRMLRRSDPNNCCLAESGDALQNSVIRLLRTLRALRPPTLQDFFNLAAVHIRRELLDMARRCAGKSKPRRGTSADGSELSAQAQTEPETCPVEDIELWVQFHKAVDELPLEELEVVSFVFYHGWTQARVASWFNVDKSSIHQRWSGACERLRAALGGSIPC